MYIHPLGGYTAIHNHQTGRKKKKKRQKAEGVEEKVENEVGVGHGGSVVFFF